MLTNRAIDTLIAKGYQLVDGKAIVTAQQVRDLYAQTYWANERPEAMIEKSFEHSWVIAIEKNGAYVALSRWVTDYATFAYLCDVIVDKEHRGQGLSKWLLTHALSQPEFMNLRRMSLITRDAHGVYEPFGFKVITAPERYMERFIG